MPIDPSIPLQVRPVQNPSLTQSYGNLLALKNMQTQGQLQQQAVERGGIENQSAQMDLDSTKAIQRAYVEAHGDMDKTIELGKKYGAKPDVLIKLKSAALEQKQKIAEYVGTQGKNAQVQADLMKGAHDAVDHADAPNRPIVYQQQLAGLKSAGLDTSQMPPEYPGDDAFKVIGAAVIGHKQQIDDALKAAQTASATAEVAQKAAQTAKLQAETNPQNPADPNIRKQKYEGILQKIKGGGVSAATPEEIQFAQAYELGEQKTSTQSDNLGVTATNTSKPSGLSSVMRSGRSPAQVGTPSASGATNAKDSIVDAIGLYKYNPTLLNRLVVKHPEILGQVTTKYPDWQQSNYNAINKAVTDLAPSGKTGQQITSYNTFLRHAGALYDAVDSLDNSKSSDLLNKPLNWLAQHTGDPRVADFMAAMQPPMKEFQSFLLNNHAMHVEDVKDAHSLIDVNKTPQEIRAVLKRFAETGSARLGEQNESFKRVTGKDIPDLVSPEAAKAYNKITGGQSGKVVRMVAPSGQEKDVPADQVEHFKSLGAKVKQ